MSARSKPFQAATVKAATVALSGGNPLRRFLVADEVGLGKTVVARDTLAALASKARKFTVYYITSGLKVADQNKIELLRFLEKDEAKDALSIIDRVGLIPFEEKRKGKLRLYAFTPTTSFSSSQRLYGGKAVERAFIKLLLDELYPGLTAAFPEGYLEYGATSGWRWACEEAQGKFDNVSALFKAAYGRALRAEFGKPGRALYRHLPELFDYREQHFARLVRFCWTRLRTYLDRPVFWSILPGEDATQKYQNACVDGCLEAVLDEHFWLRKSKVNPDGLIEDLSAALAANVGTFGFKGAKKKDKIRIRCHAAVPFGGTETETHRQDHDVNEPPPARSEEIRSAFNTPFWPHVLATTSVGQEGLDFHSWCDRLGHWDLCSSPVDLEQREGRVQRFGGLTVRQPLARKLGEQALAQARRQASSPWDIIARDADKAFADDKTGLSPWWAMEGAELKRHLFALPQSRDIDRFAKLKTQRLLYRLALGQPDQEDLVDLLTHHDVETTRSLQALTLDLSAFSRQKDRDE